MGAKWLLGMWSDLKARSERKLPDRPLRTLVCGYEDCYSPARPGAWGWGALVICARVCVCVCVCVVCVCVLTEEG